MIKKMLCVALLCGLNGNALLGMEHQNKLIPAEVDNLAELQQMTVDQLCMHEPKTGDTPLRKALRKGDMATQNYLIEHGALQAAIEDVHKLTEITSMLIAFAISGETEERDTLRHKCLYSYEKVGLESFSFTLFSFWQNQPPCTLDVYKIATFILKQYIKILTDGVAECPEEIKLKFANSKCEFKAFASIQQKISDLCGSQSLTDLAVNDSEKMITVNDVLSALGKINEYLDNGDWFPSTMKELESHAELEGDSDNKDH
jgi:hypothetical protein